MPKKSQDVSNRRYTLMWVPQGGRGTVRQLDLTLRQIRWVAVGAVLAVGLSLSLIHI